MVRAKHRYRGENSLVFLCAEDGRQVLRHFRLADYVVPTSLRIVESVRLRSFSEQQRRAALRPARSAAWLRCYPNSRRDVSQKNSTRFSVYL